MLEEVIKERWVQYADAVGDYNPIHRDEEAAKKCGFESVIAPGMYIASFIQKCGNIKKIGVLFLRPVNDGDKIEINVEKKRILKYGKTIVRLRELEFGNPDNLIIDIPKFNYIYNTRINKENIESFLKSIGMKSNKLEKLPEAYLAALSAPALLDYGKRTNKVGIHVFQSIAMHFPYEIGKLNIGIHKLGNLNSLEGFELYWLQNNKVVASGEAKIKTL